VVLLFHADVRYRKVGSTEKYVHIYYIHKSRIIVENDNMHQGLCMQLACGAVQSIYLPHEVSVPNFFNGSTNYM
jgi:hypothetical protein